MRGSRRADIFTTPSSTFATAICYQGIRNTWKISPSMLNSFTVGLVFFYWICEFTTEILVFGVGGFG